MTALSISPAVERMTVSCIAKQLQTTFPELFLENIGRIPVGKHRIMLRPGAKAAAISQPRPVPLSKRQLVEDALHKMLEDKLIEPIDCSEWVHPMVTVFKKDKSVRICADLRALNEQITIEKFVLPTAEELFVKFTGAKFFSKLDLRSAFHHMPLTDDSKQLTAFLTPMGLFQYRVLPMGLSSAPSAWQRFMTHNLANVPGCVVYMDDICVFGSSAADHDSNLHKVLQKLSSLNLRLNPRKCQFHTTEITFLGHVISNAGIKPSTDNTKAILDAPAPQNLQQLKSFLGLCSYYLNHLPNFATIAEPLRALSRFNVPYCWSDEQEAAFQRIKQMIVSVPVVAIFDENLPTVVSTDASGVGLGAVLSQTKDGKEIVVAYASRTLTDAERKYSVGEKEALACLWACEKWHLYLFGRCFTLRTDHSALTALLQRGTKGHKPLRIERWYARLLNYSFILKYRPGSQNQVADALSRLPLPDAELETAAEEELIASLESTAMKAITRQDLRDATNNDIELQELKSVIQGGNWPKVSRLPENLRLYYPLRNELSVVDDCIMRDTRFIPPSSLIERVVACAHEGHPGITKTRLRAAEWFWWPRMSATIEISIRNCAPCQNSDKSAKPIDSAIQPVNYPMRPWAKIAIDIMGPFSSAPTDKRNILVATCYYSKWPEAHLCGEVTAHNVIRWLKNTFSRFGLPEEIVTDNGPQFTSQAFSYFLLENGVKHIKTVPYNPPANGMVERLNRSLKESIQTIQLAGENWEDAVLKALFSYRTCTHRATGKTPGEMFYGRKLRTRLNAAHSLPRNQDSAEVEKRERYQNSYAKATVALEPGTFVRVKLRTTAGKGYPSFSRPIAISRQIGPASYLLSDGRKVNARQLHSAHPVSSNPVIAPGHDPNIQTDPVRRSMRYRRPVTRFAQDFQRKG